VKAVKSGFDLIGQIFQVVTEDDDLAAGLANFVNVNIVS
jgi:hypothetical protein